MSRRTLIDAWVAAQPPKARAAALRAAQIVTSDSPAAQLRNLVADETRAAGTRYRDVLAVRHLARELVRHNLLSGPELLEIEDVAGPDSRTAPAQKPTTAAMLAAADRCWPPDTLRHSTAAAAIALITAAKLTPEQAAPLTWNDIDLKTGHVADTKLTGRALAALGRHHDLLAQAGHDALVFPALVRGRGPARIAQPPRPTSARTLHRLLSVARNAL